LYLSTDWAGDPIRRAKCGLPEDIRFQTKPEIALQQVRQAVADGVPPAVALMDPAYGNDSKLRAGISELGLSYAVGILPITMLWRPGEMPLSPAPRSGRGRPAKRLPRDDAHQPVSGRHWLWNSPRRPGRGSRGGRVAT
jgi:SRSO17 transposase